MKIAFHGAARTVTGSKHLITLKSGLKILLDCGMFQGMGPETDVLNKEFGFDPAEVDLLVLSHAHIDHCGLIPKLVKEGFKGKAFCTPATYDLIEILLHDSAGIQEYEAKKENRDRDGEHHPFVEPLYRDADVEPALSLFRLIDYEKPTAIHEQVELTYTDAGHILGSAAVSLKIRDNDRDVHLTFSGDVGQYNNLILRSPQKFPQAEIILIESTYGNSLHKDAPPSQPELLRYIKETCLEKRGRLVIPSFSVGRTQQLLYDLNRLLLDGKLKDIPVFLDSPLSIEATDITKKHPECYNKDVLKIMERDEDPFGFPGLTYIKSVDESKALNFRKDPCVIISASGMADAGRVKHHIIHSITDARNTILMVGYCEPHSLGGRLLEKPDHVNIYGDRYPVKAEIGSIRSMSAHGDYEDLSQFLSCQDPAQVRKLFLVHGEYDVQQDFRNWLIKKGFADVEIPEMHQEIGLG
jgi:metallo-beta-lactamase family protein